MLFDGSSPAGGFYQKFDDAFCAIDCGNQVRSHCEPFYCSDRSVGGRPGVDPEVCFDMLFVGFFENITSERGIVAHCADSLALRSFLHYELTEQMPHHSTSIRIRQRLDSGIYRSVFSLVLGGLKRAGMLKGMRLGVGVHA